MTKQLLLSVFAVVPVIATASTDVPSYGTPISFSVCIIDPVTPMDVKHPKAPVQPPYVTYQDHTLFIWGEHAGYTLTLLDDSESVVYQTYIPAGVQTVSLPEYLSGSYTLQLSDGTYLFTGCLILN